MTALPGRCDNELLANQATVAYRREMCPEFLNGAVQKFRAILDGGLSVAPADYNNGLNGVQCYNTDSCYGGLLMEPIPSGYLYYQLYQVVHSCDMQQKLPEPPTFVGVLTYPTTFLGLVV